ncbi:CoA-transferase [Pseudochelatococcus sp. B33]
MSKLITVEEVATYVGPGARLAIPGNASILVPDVLLSGVEKRFLEEGRPHGIKAFLPCTSSLGPGTGLDRLAHEGLLMEIVAASYPIYQGSPIVDLVKRNVVKAWNVPMGALYALLREIGAGRPGLLTKVGLGTFVDPAEEGGRLNEVTTENFAHRIKFNDEDFIFYPSIPLDVTFLKASTADEIGNIAFDREPQTLGSFNLALATKASAGKVFVQVDRVVAKGTLDPKLVKIPGALIDGVVLAPSAPQSAASIYDPTVSGEVRGILPRSFDMPGPERAILQRAAGCLRKGWLINLGVGLGADLPKILHESDRENAVTVTTEHGVFNGLPDQQPSFGAHKNPDAILDATEMFDVYDGGLLDATFLGIAQIDQLGNINVSKFSGRIMGCGGFIDITHKTKNLHFCGLFSAHGLRERVEDGKLIIENEGKIKKFVSAVEQVTLNGRQALSRGQSVTVITERVVLKLTGEGWQIVEIAPGVDLERDVFPMMDFRPLVADKLELYPEAVMRHDPAGLGLWLDRTWGQTV